MTFKFLAGALAACVVSGSGVYYAVSHSEAADRSTDASPVSAWDGAVCPLKQPASCRCPEAIAACVGGYGMTTAGGSFRVDTGMSAMCCED